MRNILTKLFRAARDRRLSPQDRARIAFEKRAREQFLRLKEKGLGITVATL